MKQFLLPSLFFCLFALHGCSRPKGPLPALATVNGEAILVEDFEKAFEMEKWKFGNPISWTKKELREVKNNVLNGLIKKRILLQEARKRQDVTVSKKEVEQSVEEFKKSYAKEDDFERFLRLRNLTEDDFYQQRLHDLMIRKLMDKVVLQNVDLSEERLKQYYQENIAQFKHPEQIHVRQIVSDSEEKTKSLRTMISEGALFEEVAKKYSLSPDRQHGGDLGWFGRGVMPKEFDRICFRLPLKELSPVVQTPYGYHLFEVLERRGAGQFAFDQVKENIIQALQEEEGKEIFKEWYQKQLQGAEIEVQFKLLDMIS